MIENIIGGALLIGVFAVFPIFVCAVVGNAKGHRWFIFALLGFLSMFGILIALLIPPVQKTSDIQPALRKLAVRVRLTWRDVSFPDHSVGEIEAEVVRCADRSGSPPPLLEDASAALQLKAASIGANAVARVEFFRSPPKFWSFAPCHRLKIRGIAYKVSDDQLAQVPSDAEDIQHVAEMQDPREMLSQAVTSVGVISIVFACLNAGAVFFLTQIGAERALRLSAGAYVLDFVLLLFGILLLRVRTSGMILTAGITIIVLGALTLIVSSIVFGVVFLLSGIGIIRSAQTVSARVTEYDQQRADITKRIHEQPKTTAERI